MVICFHGCGVSVHIFHYSVFCYGNYHCVFSADIDAQNSLSNDDGYQKAFSIRVYILVVFRSCDVRVSSFKSMILSVHSYCYVASVLLHLLHM